MMAVRDRLYKEGSKSVDESNIAAYIEIARKIGCDPEVWKLTFTRWRYYGFKPGRELFYSIVSFFNCQYQPLLRLTKLLSDRYM